MPGFSHNPLFQRAQKELRQAAQAEFRRSTLGRLTQLAKDARRGGASAASLSQLRRLGGLFGSGDPVREILGADVGSMTRMVERYARRGGDAWNIFSAILDQLGPAGQLLKGVAKAGTGSIANRELDAATELLRAFGFEVLAPGGKRAKVADIARGIEAAKEYLSQHGYEVKEPGGYSDTDSLTPTTVPSETSAKSPRPGPQLPFGIDPTTTQGEPRKTVTLPVGTGNKRFPIDHPIVTRRMVETPESSNVYTYGYDVETWNLYVRYKAPGKPGATGFRAHAPGPLYAYSNVPPEVFVAMVKAPSKGTYLWDNIRIRGTISGHRYDYHLAGISGGYVPRKATIFAGGQEGFLRRTIRDPVTGAVYRSALPDTGNPNRGTPGRGTPRRGR